MIDWILDLWKSLVASDTPDGPDSNVHGSPIAIG